MKTDETKPMGDRSNPYHVIEWVYSYCCALLDEGCELRKIDTRSMHAEFEKAFGPVVALEEGRCSVLPGDYKAPWDVARVIQVIETTLQRRGKGKSEADLVRVITQYWTLDGKCICEIDPCASR